MVSKTDLARYRANLKSERDAIALYERLAEAEPNADLSEIYRKLAATEQRHAKLWADKLRAAGETVPAYGPSWRTRILGWLAKRFGPGIVLPSVANMERGAAAEYDGQPDAEALGLPVEERSHARVFSHLAHTSQGMEGSEVARFEGRHRSMGGNALRAGVLGANDGLVSVFSLVMGVAGAEVPPHTILLTGLAGLLAGALSMALGEWLSVQSSRELYSHQIGIEKQELEDMPEEEKAELALIYQAKGLPADEAYALADRLLSNEATALDTLTREELGINPEELGGSAWEAALMSFFLFSVGALIPILPYFFTSGMAGVAWSVALSGIGLFVIGAGMTLVTGRNALVSGLRQVLFGLAAAAITFGVGRLIGVNIVG